MHIVGTAGHVDHGKSSLVRALTGTNPDRWAEEQLRGMTLDLGFARLRFEDGFEAGIVDVPGHERFLHNMLAGAAGMEILLLAVAADEGVMPQTLEHLQILKYLNVRRVLVAVTKADVVGADDLPAATERIAEGLRDTIAANAAMLAVSSITGEGLDRLRARIHDELAELPPRSPQAPAYLPVDRVFALAGHGTIVTGTLMQGTISLGDRLKLQPSGKDVRVRGLQTFGEKRERVEGGARVAVNMPGIEVHEIARGEMLVAPELRAAPAFSLRFDPLPGALPLLRRRNAVRAYIGSAEILGTLVFDAAPKTAVPANATLFLRRATVAYPGSAVVLRRLSPKDLLGGGAVLAASASEMPVRGATDDEQAVLRVLRAIPNAPQTPREIANAANLREEAVETALGALAERGEVQQLHKPVAYVDASFGSATLERVLKTLDEAHRCEPWAMGATSLGISRALGMDEALVVRLLAAFVEEGRIEHRAGYYAKPGYAAHLSAEQRAFFDRTLQFDPNQPLAPLSLPQVVAAVRSSSVRGVGKAFDTLFAKGALVKVHDDLYSGSQIAKIRAQVESFLHQRQRMTMSEFRDLLGTSRKYAVPLLEWFDARGITVRSGDYRMLRGAKERTQ